MKVDDVTEHKMHSEHYEISQEVADLIWEQRKAAAGDQIGATSCRTVESVATLKARSKRVKDGPNIFIYPVMNLRCWTA